MPEIETKRKVYSVTELTKGIKLLLEENFPFTFVSGEISNFKNHSSGHWYFTLKDSGAQIRVVMFRGSNRGIKFQIEDGLEVIVGGRVTVYEQQGQYQIVAETCEPKGLGALQLAFEQLKAKLEKEGLFNMERKRPIPFLSRRVGIVTSPTGAVIQDMIHVTQRRFPGLPLLLVPVRVQGEGASEEICEGIRMLNQISDVDVIIVGRGGGSLEDLWPFNEEKVAREIFNSKIPIISAVGHETDWTIADFVADRRAPTPSAAAEMVAPHREELIRRILDLRNRVAQGVLGDVEEKKRSLKRLLDSYAFRQPRDIIEQYTQRLDEIVRQMINYSDSLFREKKTAFQSLVAHLEALSPLGVLARGYSLTLNEKGHAIRSIKEVKAGERLRSRVSDGFIDATVKGVEKSSLSP
jgi:exodeoxyribonuclease VII large subunit